MAMEDGKTRIEDSYAVWVRRVLKRMRTSGGKVAALFDSSVPEPTDILADLVARGFAPLVTDRYVSAFTGGNRFVVARLGARYGVGPEHILCTTGATGALSLLYRSLVKPGERIAVETPGFDLFAGIATLYGIKTDTFARRPGDFSLDLDALAAAIRPDTRLVVLSNLHNPSGALLTDADLVAVARLAEARDVLVVVDEVYGDYADRAARPRPAASISPRLVSVDSLTKLFGLSTLRCGWIVGDPAVIRRVTALSERFEFGVSNLAHAAAALVLENTAVFDQRTRAVLAASRPIAAAAFSRLNAAGLIVGDLPAFGCIAFPQLVGIDDTAHFAEWLGDRLGVLVAPGEYFGAPGHVRIGFAQDPDALRAALEAFEEGLRAYRAIAEPRLASAV